MMNDPQGHPEPTRIPTARELRRQRLADLPVANQVTVEDLVLEQFVKSGGVSPELRALAREVVRLDLITASQARQLQRARMYLDEAYTTLDRLETDGERGVAQQDA